MPVDLATAQQLIQARGVQPPSGVQPGTPAFDQWAVQWLQGAVNAGDPQAIQAAGGYAGSPDNPNSANAGGEEIAGGYTMPWENAADPSEWLGKRAPTPSELRKWGEQQHASYLQGQGGQDEDYRRWSDRQLAAWIQEGWDPQAGGWKQGYTPNISQSAGGAGGAGGGGGGGGGTGAGGSGGYGGSPTLNLPTFKAPTWEEAMSDPGYQFALNQGLDALQGSQAAQGLLRTGGSLQDLINYGQNAAATQYQNVYNRAANTYGLNTNAQIQEFQPNWNAWSQVSNQNLQKYLQQQGNIFDLLNSPPPWAYGAY